MEAKVSDYFGITSAVIDASITIVQSPVMTFMLRVGRITIGVFLAFYFGPVIESSESRVKVVVMVGVMIFSLDLVLVESVLLLTKRLTW